MLWKEIEELSAPPSVSSSAPSIYLPQQLYIGPGWVGSAMLCIYKSLSSSGVANCGGSAVQVEILKCHSEGPILVDSNLPDLPPAINLRITVTVQSVFKALRAFPKGSSPEGFQLWVKHPLDAVCGFTAPVAQEYLHQLTLLINFILSGKASCLIVP